MDKNLTMFKLFLSALVKKIWKKKVDIPITMWKVSKTNWSINFKDQLCDYKLEFSAFEHEGCWSLLSSLIPYEHCEFSRCGSFISTLMLMNMQVLKMAAPALPLENEIANFCASSKFHSKLI